MEDLERTYSSLKRDLGQEEPLGTSNTYQNRIEEEFDTKIPVDFGQKWLRLD